MSGAPRDLTEISKLAEDVTASLVDSLERHALGLQKHRRSHRHGTLAPAQIRALRKILGLTQGTLANQIGASRLSVTSWETNNRNPNRTYSQRLRRLASLNGIDADQLSDEGYVRQNLKARVTMEPMKVVLEKLERVVAETTRL